MLVAERQRCGLTQEQVAAKLQKPQSFVSKYERGERRIDFTEFIEIANLFGTDIANFVADYRHANRALVFFDTQVPL